VGEMSCFVWHLLLQALTQGPTPKAA